MAYQLLHFSDLHLDASFAADGNSARSVIGVAPTCGRRWDASWRWPVNVGLTPSPSPVTSTSRTTPCPTPASSWRSSSRVWRRLGSCIAPGEHDPYINQSLYSLTRWPDNVVIFNQGQLTTCELATGVHLWGAACPPERGHQVLESVTVDRESTNLLLLHVAPVQAPGEARLFSVNPDTLRRSGFDFALLGGKHTSRLWPENEPIAVYSGSPEPLRRDEADGAHHVVLISVDGGHVLPELIPISQWRYHDLTIDVTDCTAVEGAAKRVARALETLPNIGNERAICDVTLTGLPSFDLDMVALHELLEIKAHVRFNVRLSTPYKIQTIAQEQTVRGTLVRRFLDRLAETHSDQERRPALRALHVALQALDGKQVCPHEIA